MGQDLRLDVKAIYFEKTLFLNRVALQLPHPARMKIVLDNFNQLDRPDTLILGNIAHQLPA